MSTQGERALKRATQQRSTAAEHAVVHAIEAARTNGGRVTVAGIAKAAGVSADFIYRHPTLRPQVEMLRRTSRNQHSREVDESEHDAAASTLVRRLTQQVTRERAEHRAELGRLRSALEAAHGELLQLRRQLDDRTNTHPS
ncbi:MAG: DUF6262 family protein [Leifsonia sp.]